MKKLVSILISLIIVVASLSCGLTTLADDNTNLMLGATFSANGSYNNGWYNVNRPLSNLNDGATYVGTGYNTGKTATIPMEADGTGYVNAEFATATTLNKIDIYFAGKSADAGAIKIRDFAIDVKLEDGTWKRVAEQHLAEWTNWDAKKVALCFDAVTVTDVRLTIKATSSAFIYEIAAFYDSTLTSANNTPIVSNDYTADAIPMPAYADIMTNVTFSANGAYNNGWYNVNRPLSNLNDGDTYVGIGYNTGKTATIPMEADGTGYVNAEFATATTLNKIDIYFAGKSADASAIEIRDFAIDVKLEDGTWKRVAEQHLAEWTNWDAKKVVLCFDAVKVTDVRLTIKATSSAFIYEIDAFNINTQTSNSNTPIVTKNYTADAIPMPTYADIMTNVTFSANNAYNNGWYNVNRPLSNLNDGDTFVGIGYNTGKTATIPMEADGTGYVNAAFATPTTLNKIDIYFAGKSADASAIQIRDFAVDVRFDDGTWKRVAEKHLAEWTNWDAKKVALCFDAVTVTDVRLTIKATGSAFIYEIDAFDIYTQTSADNTALEEGVNIPMPVSVDWVADEDVAEPQDYAYSFALVGDTQIVSRNDALNGTNDLANMYQYIIDKKDEYKIAQVIGLGDIVDTYADGQQKENEWKVATSAISKLDGVLPYTLVSGNHDVNWNFNYRIASGLPNYLKQPQVISNYGKKEAGVETDEPSVANTAHEFTVNGVDYLIVTIEYAAHSTEGVMDWANNIIKNHPHHNVIVTTHAYLSDNGDILDGTNNGSPSSYAGSESHNNGDYFWDNLISKHENISMVICGHVGTENIVKSTKIGDNGNTVTQIMVNTQDLDKEIGSTGTVAFLYFSEDGKNVQVRQYSTVRERYLGSNSQTTFEVATARAAIQGDINNDANVDVRDLVAYKMYFADIENYWIDLYTSDFDDNGLYDAADLSSLMKLLLSK